MGLESEEEGGQFGEVCRKLEYKVQGCFPENDPFLFFSHPFTHQRLARAIKK